MCKRRAPNGWWVDFEYPITTTDPYGITEWVEANATGAFSICLDSIGFAIEDDALMCFLRFA